MASQIERRLETRSRIVAAARVLFVANGYDETSIEQVIAAAGMSKGAVYHHFANKTALFEAVFEDVSRETIARALAAARQPNASPVRTLVESAVHWLHAVEDREACAIMLDQAPRALGVVRAREIESQIAHPLMKAAIDAAVAAGEADCLDADLAIHLINAVLTELALLRHGSAGRFPSDAMLSDILDRAVRALVGAV